MPIATPTLIAVFSFDAGTVAGWTAGNAGNRYFDSVSTPAALSLGGGDYALSFTGTGIRNAELTASSLGTVNACHSVQHIVFPTALPSNSPDVFIGSSTNDQVFVYFDQPTSKLKATWAGGSAVTGTHTLTHSTPYLLETYIDPSANPNRLRWRVNGIDQPDATSAVAAGNVTSWMLGRDGSVAGAYYFPYAAVSVTAADWPLGPLRIPMLTPDSGGTITVNGSTANFGLFSGSTPTEAAWNAATALTNIGTIPLALGASATGIYQIARTDSTHYIEIPMTSTTLAAGEQVAGAQLDVIGAAVTTTAATIGFRTYNGTTERILFAAADPNFDNSSTAPAWIRRMLTTADVDTQAELDALAVRMGFSTDVSPHIGIHRVYINVAVRLVTSGTVAGTLPSLTGTMAGAVAGGSITGTVQGNLPALTGSTAGAVSVTGAAAGTLPALTGSMAGSVRATGTIAGSLPALTGATAGTVTVTGAVSGSLPAVTGALSGAVGITGAIGDTLPGVTGSASGTVTISGSLAGQLPALTGGMSGTVGGGVTGVLTGTLPMLVGSAAGRVGVTAVVDGTLPAVVGSLLGRIVISGGIASLLPAVTGSAAGSVTITGGIGATLPAPTGSLAGTVMGDDAYGVLAGAFPAFSGSLTGAVEATPGTLHASLVAPSLATTNRVGLTASTRPTSTLTPE
jgi:hypothetical protein